jgi:uncharacterized protein YjbK
MYEQKLDATTREQNSEFKLVLNYFNIYIKTTKAKIIVFFSHKSPDNSSWSPLD